MIIGSSQNKATESRQIFNVFLQMFSIRIGKYDFFSVRGREYCGYIKRKNMNFNKIASHARGTQLSSRGTLSSSAIVPRRGSSSGETRVTRERGVVFSSEAGGLGGWENDAGIKGGSRLFSPEKEKTWLTSVSHESSPSSQRTGKCPKLVLTFSFCSSIGRDI